MIPPICLWSGPRNVSTALMYGFAQLSSVQVVDEPLYGHYLRVSRADHPGREQIMQAMNCDGDAVMQALLRPLCEPGIHLFLKHMAHHLVDLDLDFLQSTRNVFLVRDPRQMLPSLVVQLPHAALRDTGLARQWQLYRELSAQGQAPAILDSRELLLNPEGVLRKLCRHLALDFDIRMLSWPSGARSEDGVWAPHWYQGVHNSTGFAPYVEKSEFPDHLQPLLDECKPYYDKLYDHAIRADLPGD